MRYLLPFILLFFLSCTQQQDTASSDEPEEVPVEKIENVATDEMPPASSSQKVVHTDLKNLPHTGYPYGPLLGLQVVFDREKVEMIPVYDAPGGKKVSQLKLFFRGEVEAGLVLQPEGVDFSDYEATNNSQYYKTGYDFELIYLNYYAIKAGFVQILAKDHENYWVAYKDIAEHFRPIRFIEDIITRNGWQLFGYNNYRLRKAPNLEGEIILKLDERKHVIKKFTQIEGNWAEALVYETKIPMDGCYSDEDLENSWTGVSYTGWIRVVDENGQVSDINFYSSC